MNLDLSLNLQIIQFLAVFARVAGFIIGAPVFGHRIVPKRLKGGLAIMLTVLFLPVMPANWMVMPPESTISLPFLIGIIGSELLTGLLAGFIIRCIFEVFAMGGEFTSLFMGLVRARIVNPGTETTTTLIAILYTQLIMVLFIVTGGLHMVIKLAQLSFEILPPGAWLLEDQMKEYLIQHVGKIFYIGFKIAMPVCFAVLLVNMGLGIMTRFGQEFNVLMISFPIRFGLAFIIIGFSIPALVTLANQEIGNVFTELRMIMSGFP